MHTAGTGKYRVWMEKKSFDEGILLIVGGGEKSHIGGIVVAEPEKKPQVTRFPGHYDDIILQPLAEEACRKYHTRVVALGGIHVDNASQKEIEQLVENGRGLIPCI